MTIALSASITIIQPARAHVVLSFLGTSFEAIAGRQRGLF
jgi:hypothetical protein